MQWVFRHALNSFGRKGEIVFPLQRRATQHCKRHIRTPSLTHNRAFKQAQGRIQQNRLLGIQVGRRGYGEGVVHVVGVVLERDDF